MPPSATPGRPSDAPMHFRVLGPDVGGVTLADLRRLFKGQRLTAARRGTLESGGRILALCDAAVVGLAAYERNDRELRVLEFGVDIDSPCGGAVIANGLLEALELGCVAGDIHRLIVQPRAGHLDAVLNLRGYRPVSQTAAGIWFEKRFA